MMRKEFPRVTPESVGIPSTAVEQLLFRFEGNALTIETPGGGIFGRRPAPVTAVRS